MSIYRVNYGRLGTTRLENNNPAPPLTPPLEDAENFHKQLSSQQIPSQPAYSVVGYPPHAPPPAPQHAQNHVFPQRAYYDDPRRPQAQFQQPIYQPAPDHPEHFRNQIPLYAQPPQQEQMAPAAQNFYPGASMAPQQQAYSSQQPHYARPQEYHQPTHHMHHPINGGPGHAVGYAPSVIDQRSASQAPPHHTNEKVIQYVIQLPRIHDQAMHTSAPAPQIIIK
ncbi:unnamed protein product [Oikopleura dioica]|uniref:Uncharacterized protein n=1 Tax=Oikopleura dioica TaxID=34765 RepID=E4X9X3_OIKDI|nr:unnamed protein product [Oikopleura dioica]